MTIMEHPADAAQRAENDALYAAFLRGESIRDRRPNLFRWSWCGRLPYEEAERLLPEDELDDLCDLLRHLQEDAVFARAYAVSEAYREGWITTLEERNWLRRECELTELTEQSAEEAAQMQAWLGGERIEHEIERLACWARDARIDWDVLDRRITDDEFRRMLALADPDELVRLEALDREIAETANE